MHAKLNYTNIGPRIAVSKPITSHISTENLLSVPPRQRFTSIYKRMYKLRFMAGNSQSQQNDFCNLLRRRFSRHDFNLRRNLFLGVDDQLLEEAFTKRLVNTYAFVFNATCEPEGSIPEVNFYDELKESLKPRVETSVLHTMIMMERETPPIIKYDHKYKWVEDVKKFYGKASGEILKKEVNDLIASKSAHHIGFYQYERSLAHLNESLSLCL